VPLFDFKCSKCGNVDEQMHRYPRKTSTCPVCGSMSKRIFTLGRGSQSGEGRVIYSSAMGCHPDQIPEMKRHFPHHEFTPDGRMIVRGPAAQKRIAKELNMVVL